MEKSAKSFRRSRGIWGVALGIVGIVLGATGIILSLRNRRSATAG
jgi:hypothetical protein